VNKLWHSMGLGCV